MPDENQVEETKDEVAKTDDSSDKVEGNERSQDGEVSAPSESLSTAGSDEKKYLLPGQENATDDCVVTNGDTVSYEDVVNKAVEMGEFPDVEDFNALPVEERHSRLVMALDTFDVTKQPVAAE